VVSKSESTFVCTVATARVVVTGVDVGYLAAVVTVLSSLVIPHVRSQSRADRRIAWLNPGIYLWA
jgi:hypothetical protein